MRITALAVAGSLAVHAAIALWLAGGRLHAESVKVERREPVEVVVAATEAVAGTGSGTGAGSGAGAGAGAAAPVATPGSSDPDPDPASAPDPVAGPGPGPGSAPVGSVGGDGPPGAGDDLLAPPAAPSPRAPAPDPDAVAIHAAVQRAVHYPRAARDLGTTCAVTVRFRIDDQGAVAELTVVDSSGELFDGAAIDAVRRAAPFAAGHAGWVRTQVRFSLSAR